MNMNDLFAAVMNLNLDPIKEKLMHVESGEGWSAAKANAVEKEYRRFLCLMKMYPNEMIAPLVDVDTFWHYHILDTMKYAKDCEQAFGYFVHHYPYIGMRGKEDEQVRLDSGELMRTLYEATFGDSFAERAAELSQLSAVRTVPVPSKPGARPIDLSGMATAYCAGPVPHVSATAYCAGPVPHVSATAYCAGPVPHVSATAYCAGPVPHVSATAYCAGPVPHVGKAASRAGAQPAAMAGH
jgi:hypothetical protein